MAVFDMIYGLLGISSKPFYCPLSRICSFLRIGSKTNGV